MNSVEQALKRGQKINQIFTRAEYLMLMEAVALELLDEKSLVDITAAYTEHQQLMRKLEFDNRHSRHGNDTDHSSTFITLCDTGFIVKSDGGRPYLMPRQPVRRTKTASRFLGQLPQRVAEAVDIIFDRRPSVLELMARAAK